MSTGAADATPSRTGAVDARPHRSRDGLEYLDEGSGPTLLLVHGSAAACEFWWSVVPALAGDFRVVAPSLPGFGTSPRLAGPPRDLGPYADAVAALLREIGAEPAVVAGHSLGGLVCARLATEHPQMVRTLVLVDSGGVAMGRIRLALIVRALLAVGAVVRRPRVTRAILRRPGLRRRLFARALYKPDALDAATFATLLRGAVAPGLSDAVVAGAHEQETLSVPKIAVPITVIWGRNDRILPLRLGVDLVARVPSAVLDVIDDAGHAPMLEQPEAFVAALRRASQRADD